jgi:hypothetical protein
MSAFTVYPAPSDVTKGFLFNVVNTRAANEKVTAIQVTFTDANTKAPFSNKSVPTDQEIKYYDNDNNEVTESIFYAINSFNFSEENPCPIYVKVDKAVANKVYLANIKFTVSVKNGDAITNRVVSANIIDTTEIMLPVMIDTATQPTFILDKPTMVKNKNVLSVMVKNDAVPIKFVNFSVEKADGSGESASVEKMLYDPNNESAKYGVIATNAGILFEISSLDLSNNGIIGGLDTDITEYNIFCSVTPMNNVVVDIEDGLDANYAPARINAPEITWVKQSNIDTDDSTLEFKFKPPSDLVALENSGIVVGKYIITNESGDIAGIASNDISGNKIYDNSGNGLNYWLDGSGNYRQPNSTIIAKKIREINASDVTSTIDACGNYLKSFVLPLSLTEKINIETIGITAYGSDTTYSLTSSVDISFNDDLADGMTVRPHKPVITTSSVDSCGNLILSVTGATRTFDVSFNSSSNFPVFPTDASGNLNGAAYSNTVVTSTTLPLENGYNKARNYNVKIPNTAFTGVNGGVFNFGVTMIDVSNNSSVVSSKYTYIKQVPAEKPNFVFREINDSEGKTKLHIAFDQSGNNLPALGLGSLDASANPSVVLDIYRKGSGVGAVFPTLPSFTQLVPTSRYSGLASNVSGELLVFEPILAAGEQVKVIGRINTKQLNGTTQFTSLDSSAVIFSVINLTSKVTDINVLKSDMSNNTLDRKLAFTFNSPIGGAPLSKYNVDVFVNNFASPVYSGSIDASGIPLATPKEYKVTLNSTGDAVAPVAHSGSRQVLTGVDSSFNITSNFYWGDLVEVKITSEGKTDDNARLGDSAFTEVLMVPNAPLSIYNVSLSTDLSENDIVTYTIHHNGSPITNLTSMSVFWENVNANASVMTVAPTPLSMFNFAMVSAAYPGVRGGYTRNAGDISGNDLYFTYPTLKDANNIIDNKPFPADFIGTFIRSGSAMPAVSTLKVKYNTGAFKRDLDGNVLPQEGLKAVLSIINGQNQSSNSTTRVTDYEMKMVV